MPFDTLPNLACRMESGAFAVRSMLLDVTERLATLDVPPDSLDVVQIVLAEVLNNVVEHAYGFKEGAPIQLSIWMTDDGLWCQTLDEGRPMPNEEIPGGGFPGLDADDPETLPEGGFGWAMVHALARDIVYERRDGKNRLRLLIPHAVADSLD